MYIYQVVCIDIDKPSSEEFILGTYIREESAIENKEEMERQAKENNTLSLEYKINKHVVSDAGV